MMFCSTVYLTLASADVDRLVAFYAGLFQRSAQPYWPGAYAEFALPGLRLALFKPRADHYSEFQATQPGPLSLCLEVSDLAAAIAHLTHLGYPPPGPILTASHGREVYAYDPDGNRLILHQGDTPAAGR